MSEVIENVLAERYASDDMTDIWSPTGKIIAERDLWIAVMTAQVGMGVAGLSADHIADYEGVKEEVDFQSIAERERVTRHDVKARIEEFNALAGHEDVHRGMTSRDLTDNVEQAQVLRSMDLVFGRSVATLRRFGERAMEYSDLVMAGRSHNVAAQPTTLGKRFATAGDEMLTQLRSFDNLRRAYPLRGMRGPMGTQQDMLDLLGSEEKVEELERIVAKQLGFDATAMSTGQVYPRSLDLSVIAGLKQLAAGPSDFATSLRLMAGNGIVTEGFKEGQVGSSAMPHKMNARSSERINGFNSLLTGYVATAAAQSGVTWNEGDVSCSVVRRVILPDSFFATDGMLETAMTVLDEFGAYPAAIEAELNRYLPFLGTTKILMAATQNGIGREAAHEAIKEHAVAVAEEMRFTGREQNDLLDRLAADERFANVDIADLREALDTPIELTGTAQKQVEAFADAVDELINASPENQAAATYSPGEIL